MTHRSGSWPSTMHASVLSCPVVAVDCCSCTPFTYVVVKPECRQRARSSIRRSTSADCGAGYAPSDARYETATCTKVPRGTPIDADMAISKACQQSWSHHSQSHAQVEAHGHCSASSSQPTTHCDTTTHNPQPTTHVVDEDVQAEIAVLR